MPITPEFAAEVGDIDLRSPLRVRIPGSAPGA